MAGKANAGAGVLLRSGELWRTGPPSLGRATADRPSFVRESYGGQAGVLFFDFQQAFLVADEGSRLPLLPYWRTTIRSELPRLGLEVAILMRI